MDVKFGNLPIVVRILGAIPISVRRSVGAFLGYCYSLLPSRESQTARLQLERFLRSSNSKVHAREVFSNMGALIGESFNLGPYLSRREHFIHCPDS
ncbi:MAG: hypothetical protein KDD60_11075, partial [Bdellovibrionales bacterium]|nr:hypothetical protein [Bdellovibrionales bacterium]